MEFNGGDIEILIPAILRERLASKWGGAVYVGRDIPSEEIEALKLAVSVTSAGGVSVMGNAAETVRAAVNVWALNDLDANRLAADVRNICESLKGHSPIIRVTATAPAPIPSGQEAVKQRYITLEITQRRKVANG